MPNHPGLASEVPPFAVVYEDYFDFVWICARRLGIGSDSIDDVVQEVFIVIHSRLHTLLDPTALRSWIYGILRRTTMAHFRLQQAKLVSRLDTYDDDKRASAAPTPLALAEQLEQTTLLWRLLEEIDERKREVFVLAEVEEMTAPEIAQALEIPLGTVYSRLRAARQEFEVALARYNLRSNPGGTRAQS